MRHLCHVYIEDELYQRILTCNEFADSHIKKPGLPTMDLEDFLEVLIEFGVICFEEDNLGKEIF